MDTDSPKTLKREKHIEALETKVDRLEEQVTSLKHQLKVVSEKPKEYVSQEQYDKVVLIAQMYYDTLHPF